jgi:porphobilinogen synthase
VTFPATRPRRLRRSPALRRLVAETELAPRQLVLPLFVAEGAAVDAPIATMPGVVQHSLDTFRSAVAEAAEAGVGGVMIFGLPEHKDATGSGALDPDGILSRAVAAAVSEAGDALVVGADLCLDEFTDHGHCGLLGTDPSGATIVDNDRTLSAYAEMGVVLAGAGAHLVAPSGMMDGQVAAIRTALDAEHHVDTVVLAYAAKYASAFYGPFRDAVNSSLSGDRTTYQQDPANAAEAMREVRLDIEEGADIVMVKPALGYLDVVARVAAEVDVPVAAYNVSGEYAMLEAAAANGWIERRRAVLEVLTGIRRAGASIVLTYWATEAAGWLREGAA